MIVYRPANTRGLLDWPWITSRRTFSNNTYWDPKYMNYGSLKVINDDILQPGKMVPNHEHKNYDILGYIVEGKLEHTDNLGNVTYAEPGDVQHMWCGDSIWHTEKCISSTPARYLQLWMIPNKQEPQPRYSIVKRGINFELLNLTLNNNMKIYCGNLNKNFTIVPNGKSYLYIVSGSVDQYGEGDGLEIYDQSFNANFNAHVILFDNC
jgi:redox-sensitive bicupin YhaK (pirin superfamily)